MPNPLGNHGKVVTAWRLLQKTCVTSVDSWATWKLTCSTSLTALEIVKYAQLDKNKISNNPYSCSNNFTLLILIYSFKIPFSKNKTVKINKATNDIFLLLRVFFVKHANFTCHFLLPYVCRNQIFAFLHLLFFRQEHQQTKRLAKHAGSILGQQSYINSRCWAQHLNISFEMVPPSRSLGVFLQGLQG